MNRREFFKAASVAPVAVPMAVSAALAKPDPFLIRMSVRHPALGDSFIAIPETIGKTRRGELIASAHDFLPGSFRADWPPARLSVEAQMREHNLFDL